MIIRKIEPPPIQAPRSASGGVTAGVKVIRTPALGIRKAATTPKTIPKIVIDGGISVVSRSIKVIVTRAARNAK